MNRIQFMEALEEALSDIPEEERLEVLDFYEGYFDDAGEDQESEVIAKFGTPEKLALSIRYNLKESNEGYAEYTELGYEDVRMKETGEMPDQYTVVGHSRVYKSREEEHSNHKSSQREQKNDKNGSLIKNLNAKLILIIIFLIFMAPLLKGVVGGLLIGVIVALVVTVGFPIICMMIMAAITLALIVVGIKLIVSAIPFIFINIAVAILLIGLGMLSFAVVFVGLLVMKWIAVSVFPRYLRRFTGLCVKVMGTCRRFFERMKKRRY